jgi:hypothetical protein
MIEKDVCSDCNRNRNPEDDYDYNPLQVVMGAPVGWYSHPDEGDLCGNCFTKLFRIGNR